MDPHPGGVNSYYQVYFFQLSIEILYPTWKNILQSEIEECVILHKTTMYHMYVQVWLGKAVPWGQCYDDCFIFSDFHPGMQFHTQRSNLYCWLKEGECWVIDTTTPSYHCLR
jgi:hypothetical protein